MSERTLKAVLAVVAAYHVVTGAMALVAPGTFFEQIGNYALGLTRVRFVDYLVASVGMLPGTMLYVYSGTLAGDVATIAAGAPDELGARQWTIRLLGLAATIAVTAVVTRTARRALSSEVADAGT